MATRKSTALSTAASGRTSREYRYLGDTLTDRRLVGQRCEAVLDRRGKCICSRLGTMLVRFGDEVVNVLRRRLRKMSDG